MAAGLKMRLGGARGLSVARTTEIGRKARDSSWWAWQARYAPYVFVSPFVVLFVVFLVYPLGRSFWLSFYKTAGPNVSVWVGGENYRFLVLDRIFWGAVLNTVAFTVAFLVVQVPASLGLAMLVNSARVRGRNFFRFAFFTPNLVGAVFLGVLFNLFLSPKRGPVNEALRWIGISDPPNWLGDPNWLMPAVLLASLWVAVGYGMMYCLAALQNVDRALYEAAEVDGAGAWARFRHVTLPGVRPVVSYLVLVGTISSLQLFELPYVMFNGPGVGNRALTIVMYLFNVGFEQGDLGYSAAIGWALVVMVAGVGVLGVRAVEGKGGIKG